MLPSRINLGNIYLLNWMKQTNVSSSLQVPCLQLTVCRLILVYWFWVVPRSSNRPEYLSLERWEWEGFTGRINILKATVHQGVARLNVTWCLSLWWMEKTERRYFFFFQLGIFLLTLPVKQKEKIRSIFMQHPLYKILDDLFLKKIWQYALDALACSEG